MAGSLLMSRGLTRAQIMQRILAEQHIASTIIRPPLQLNGAGCGYAVRIDESQLSLARSILGRKQILPSKVYVERGGGYTEIKL